MTHQRVLYGDCRVLLRGLPMHSFELCLTDPPYRVTNWNTGFGVKGLTYGTKPPEYREWLGEVKRVLKDTGQIVVFESTYNTHPLMDALEAHGFRIKQTGVWNVTNRTNILKGPMYRNHIDVWVWAIKDDAYKFRYDRGREPMADIYTSANVKNEADERVPGIKPLDLIERFILVHTDPGDWVLDPFLGSGTTLLACRRTDRNGVGIEIRPDLRGVIEARILSGVGLETWVKERRRKDVRR